MISGRHFILSSEYYFSSMMLLSCIVGTGSGGSSFSSTGVASFGAFFGSLESGIDASTCSLKIY